MIKRTDGVDALFLSGVALVVWGTFALSMPAGLITLGVALVAIAGLVVVGRGRE